MNAPLIVVTGPPGAGKTTVSRVVAAQLSAPACVVESDWWWTTIVQGHIPPWRPEANEQNRAVVRSYSAASSLMAAAGFSTVLEGIVGPWMLDLVQQAARSQGVPLHYVVLRPELETALVRAAARAGDERIPGHPALTDPEPIRQLWQEFSVLGRYENHVLDNTDLPPEDTATRIAALIQTGKLRL